MDVVQLLPDGHRMKKEVDAALDTVSETMTPMHYHLREIIICTYRQVSLTLPRCASRCAQPPRWLMGLEGAGGLRLVLCSWSPLHLPEVEAIPERENPQPRPSLPWGVQGVKEDLTAPPGTLGEGAPLSACRGPGPGIDCGLWIWDPAVPGQSW